MAIRVLPDHVVNQIAAGEVVERPASVVRELVDNAVDAGATEITVEIQSGGQSSIRIVDNGCGMSRDDAVLCLERHATSKIHELNDLQALVTYGFRGEALAAISAVAKTRVRTRRATDAIGTEVTMDGGKLRDVREIAAPQGTEIEVRHLFFNTPARRKFLKSEKAEEVRIKQWLSQASFAYPHIKFRLISDAREILTLSKHASSVERARSMLEGAAVDIAWQTVENDQSTIEVMGVLAHPSQAQFQSQALAILVNGRLVSDKVVLRAVKEAFGATLKEREFPVGFISLQVSPAQVDVNVHPQKSEVRFRNSHRVFEAVLTAVRQAITKFRSPVAVPPIVSSSNKETTRDSADGHSSYWTEKKAWSFEPARTSTTTYSPSVVTSQETAPQRTQASLWDKPAVNDEWQVAEPSPAPKMVWRPIAASVDPFRFSELHYLAQLFACYLLCEHNGRFYVVDMHAAHERQNYNVVRTRLQQRFREGAAPAQQLLLAEELKLSDQEYLNIAPCLELLEGSGFEFDSSAPPPLLRVTHVPSILIQKDFRSVLKELAGLNPDEAVSTGSYDRVLDQVAARIACHASVRSGKQLSPEEVSALFRALDSEECSAACPHGRPVIVSFSEDEVERWFGRDR